MPGRGSVRPEKEKAVTAIKEIAEKSSSILLTDYRGMTVKQMTDLRRSLRGANAHYRIVKNTISRRALSKWEKITEKISGPIGIVFIEEDPVQPSKNLVNFIKENEKPQILSGLVQETIYSSEEVVKLSKLPSKDELIAKMLTSLNSPIYGLVNVLAGILRKPIYALNALKEKQGPSSAKASEGKQEQGQGEKGGEK